MAQHADQEFMNCPSCFVWFSAPEAMFAARRKDGGTFYCPNGHNLSWHDNENDQTRRERNRLKQQLARAEDEKRDILATAVREREERQAAERRASAARGQVTRLKNRASAGLCPCCNRSFTDLRRHMATKHAGFTAEKVQAEAGTPVH